MCCGRGLCLLRQRAVAAAAVAEVGGGGKVWQGALRLLGAGIWRAYEGGPPNSKAAQHGAKSKKSEVRIVISRNRIDQKILKKNVSLQHIRFPSGPPPEY